MRAFVVGSIIAFGLAAGLQTAGAVPWPTSNTAPAPKNVPVATHNCGKGQHWVPAGYAKHGKYRAGHCAPS